MCWWCSRSEQSPGADFLLPEEPVRLGPRGRRCQSVHALRVCQRPPDQGTAHLDEALRHWIGRGGYLSAPADGHLAETLDGIAGRSTRLVESRHGDGEQRDVGNGRRSGRGRPGCGRVPVPVRAEPGPADHVLDPALRLSRVWPGADPGARAREGARGAGAGGGDRRPVGHRKASDVRRPDDDRPLPSRVLGARVRSGPVSPRAARVLRDASLPSLAHERGRNASGPGELPAEAQRGPDDGGRTALARLRAGPRAGIRRRARRRRPGADVHHDRFRHRAGSALPAAVRLAVRRRAGRRAQAAAPRWGAAGAGGGPHRQREAPPAAAARAVRPARLHDREGGRRHRPGGPVLAQARPDRQGLDRVELALPGLAGEAPHLLPAARPAPRASRPSREIACSS